MKSFKKISTICSALILILFSQGLRAQESLKRNTDHAEAGVLIPWQFVERWVNAQSVSEGPSTSPQTLIDEKMENINFVVTDIPVHIPSAQMIVQGSFAPIQVSGNLTRLTSKNLSVDLQLAGFEVEKEFVQEIDGATIIVNLKAKCGNFAIRQLNANFMTGLAWKPVEKGFDLSAQELQISWPAQSWQVESLVCEGPQGFGTLVQNQINEALKDPTSIEAMIKPIMEQRLNAYVAQTLEPLRKPFFLDNNKIFTAEISETAVADNQGLMIKFDIVTNPAYQGISTAQTANLKFSENIWDQVDDQPLLVLPKKFIENMARHAEIFPRAENRLNNIPAFQKILDSRLLQFLFWNELRNFKKSAPFIATSLVQGQQYAVPTNPPRASFTGARNLAVSASVSTWVRAQRDGRDINWAYFDTKITGNMTYQLSKGEMVFTLQDPQIKMTAQYATEYIKKYNPKGKFPVDRIEDGMRSQLAQRSYRFAMPILSLASIGLKDQLQVSTVKEQSQNLIFSFTNARINP